MQDNRCTCYTNGCWLDCCVWHDWQCEEAWHRKDATLRLKADRGLRDCVNTGSTTIAADTGATGTGTIALQTKGVTRLAVANDGTVSISGTLDMGSR